jgi:thymidylate synthase (FAD)
MKIVEPSVKFIAVTCSVDELELAGEVEVASLTTSELLESIGRTCYKSEDKITPGSAEKFLDKLLAQDPPHESVVEHVYASFRIVCDRGVSHELVRHRIASYSQESTRWCRYSLEKFGGEISVIMPPGLEGARLATWRKSVDCAEASYLELLGLGERPEIARSVLPTCLKTEVVATLNFRSWRNFLQQRLSPKAHPQMREVAEMIRDRLVKECPPCFREFAEKQ